MGAELCGPNSPAVTTSLDENSTQASSEFLEPQMNLVRENSTEHKGKGSEPPEPDRARVGLGNWACSLLPRSPGERTMVLHFSR